MKWKATQQQIKKAHRRLALKHHPDKIDTSIEGADNAFKAIQKAYEVVIIIIIFFLNIIIIIFFLIFYVLIYIDLV